MSSYPVLNNKPIDQWKVTELREELKRRNLPLRGIKLKDELVRRLDEALRQEQMEKEEEEKEEVGEEQVETPPVPTGQSNDVETEEAHPVQQGFSEKVEAAPVVSENETAEAEAPAVLENETAEAEAPVVSENKTAEAEAPAVLENKTAEAEALVVLETKTTEASSKEKLEDPTSAPEVKLETEYSDVTEETIVEEPKTEALGVEPVCASNPLDEIPQRDSKGAEEAKPDQSKPHEQVSLVGPDTGSQVKCESISSNESNKCINVENKLKDNLNANNFDLEQVEVKQDTQGDKNKELVENQADTSNLEGENYENTPNNNINNIVGADGGSPEKLNLDRSSGDESMEEDLTENSKPGVESMGGGAQDAVKEEVNSETGPADIDKMDIAAEEQVRPTPAALSEKRKLEAGENTPNNNESIKRQRRWNTDTLNVPERQMLNLSSSSIPKDPAPPVPLKRTFNRSDSNAGTASPNERTVPPSQKPATNSLRIDKFVRPFTLKAVQELLGKTGSVSSFWMDHIKTHCYVTYSSVEEAVTTRNVVYNLQWPPNGGNQLIAEFVDPQEVKQRLEAPPQSPAMAAPPAVSPHPTVSTTPKPSTLGQPSIQQHPFSRQNSTSRNQQPQVQLPPPPPLLAPGSGNVKPVRERLPPPPPLKKSDPQPAVVTLDDLFRKTKASPRIYYLPLSEETVNAKLAARAKAAKE